MTRLDPVREPHQAEGSVRLTGLLPDQAAEGHNPFARHPVRHRASSSDCRTPRVASNGILSKAVLWVAWHKHLQVRARTRDTATASHCRPRAVVTPLAFSPAAIAQRLQLQHAGERHSQDHQRLPGRRHARFHGAERYMCRATYHRAWDAELQDEPAQIAP